MFYLTGLKNNLKTVLLLSSDANDSNNISDLKKMYINFLSRIQPKIWHPENINDKLVFDSNAIRTLINAFNEESLLTDHSSTIQLSSQVSMRLALEHIQQGLDFLNSKNEKLFAIFNLVINTLFYATSPSEGGGSVSSAIGVIWCSNRRSWSVFDILELLVHEMTHNLVFLDELRYQHYTDLLEIAKEKNFAISAVLKIPRPLDKAFHSLLVGHEILQLRLQCTGEPSEPKVHPNFQSLLNNCKDTVNSINCAIRGKNLVSTRFKDLLDMVDKNLSQVDCASLKNAA